MESAAPVMEENRVFEISPITPAIGAELSGIALAEELNEGVIADIRQALLNHKVIFFRDQHLTQEELLAFARRFGDLEIHPATPKDQPNPEILRIEHGPKSKGQENMWHSDVTWRAEPSLGSVLNAIEIPPVGGDTLFANMNLAYENLPEDIREQITGMTAMHDIALGVRKATQQKTRGTPRQISAGGTSGSANSSGNRIAYTICQRRFHQPYCRHGQGRKRCAAKAALCNCGQSGNPVPVPLDSGSNSFLGQSCLSAFCRIRLFPCAPDHATRHGQG